jgi:hypothetical protein
MRRRGVRGREGWEVRDAGGIRAAVEARFSSGLVFDDVMLDGFVSCTFFFYEHWAASFAKRI